MKKFELKIEQRKDLVKKLEELTGLKARYTFMPRCAYEVGSFTVEKDGTLAAGEGADPDIIRSLQEIGMIGEGCGAAGTEPETAAAQETEGDAERGGKAVEPEAEIPEGAGTDEEAELPADETDDSEIPDEDGPEAAEPEEAELPTGAPESVFPMNAVIDLPLKGHNAVTLRNLLNLVYSRGAIISKAVNGCFLVDRELAEAMQDGGGYSADSFLKMLADYQDGHSGGLLGMQMDSDGIHFDGFTDVGDEAHLRAYTVLAAKMNQMALSQKRIQLKEVDMTNEKFAMRTWLVRMGMDGPEYKETRRILMERLTGHSAFRTPAAEERAKAKAIQKRDELRAAKAAAAEGGTENGSL